MAITFQGEFHVAQKPEEAYDFLTDPNKFGPLLPDFEGMSVEDATHFTVKAKVGISHIRGTAEVKMHLAEAERPRRAAYAASTRARSAAVNPGTTKRPSWTRFRRAPHQTRSGPRRVRS